MDYQDLDRTGILDESVYTGIIEIPNISERAKQIVALENRAKSLGCLGVVRGLLKEYMKQFQEAKKAAEGKANTKSASLPLDLETSFVFNSEFLKQHPDVDRLGNLRCGAWFADMGGVWSQTSGGFDQIASYDPITIIGRYKNAETGVTQVEVAWARNGFWTSVKVPKSIISSASKIVSLADYDVPVTSETAKLVVKYLSELDSLNTDTIATEISTSKLGWFKGTDHFIPYEDGIIFDGDKRFGNIRDAIREEGSFDVWLDHVRELRKTNRLEIKIMLAASFGSVLLERLGALCCIVDLWGDTEGGKTVTLMLAASVWADPNESRYIGDFKATEVALETKADMLSNLPMILDDTSKVSKRIADNFEGFVYDLCSGKGKSRSNKDLGAVRENHWRNIILTNGERPLSGYTTQGGAMNRILEVQCGSHIYQDPQKTAEVLKSNFGHAGPVFVNAVCEIGKDKLKQMYDGYFADISKLEQMQKQSISLAVIMLADEIAEKYIFKDGVRITLDEAKKILTDKNEVSDGQRAYDFICEKVEMNEQRFNSEVNCEHWGMIEEAKDRRIVWLYPQALTQICKDGGFSRKAAESWMINHGRITPGPDGKTATVRRIDGIVKRMVGILITDEDIDENGFMSVDAMPDELPFE